MKSFDYYLDKIGEIGYVEHVTKDVVGVSGLPSAKTEEVIFFESGQIGQVLFLHSDVVEVLLFDEAPVKSGTRAVRTGERLSIPVGKQYLGHLINPLCQPISNVRLVSKSLETRFLVVDPLGIQERTSVCKQLETGVILVDILIPLGHGQRELVIGDRKTGKTTFLLQTVVNQAKKGTICIWAAIGKKRGEIKEIEEYFIKNKVMDKIVIMASSAEDATGLIYLTPYSAVGMAEYFKEQGLDTLVVLDDLTIHAKFYRELSLLSKRFPGRESYPVDVFFTHAALLERGGNFRHNGKTVSLTILPIAETNEGDLSGYIQTNLMSMTDGHLYFDKELFSRGRRPAINPFLSVTRVGRQTQTSLYREVSQSLMSFLVEFQKASSFIHFGAELTTEVRALLDRGEKVIDFFDHSSNILFPLNAAIYILCCLWLDFWKEEKNEVLRENWDKIIKGYENDNKFRYKLDETIEKTKSFKELLEKVKNL